MKRTTLDSFAVSKAEIGENNACLLSNCLVETSLKMCRSNQTHADVYPPHFQDTSALR